MVNVAKLGNAPACGAGYLRVQVPSFTPHRFDVNVSQERQPLAFAVQSGVDASLSRKRIAGSNPVKGAHNINGSETRQARWVPLLAGTPGNRSVSNTVTSAHQPPPAGTLFLLVSRYETRHSQRLVSYRTCRCLCVSKRDYR